MTPLNFGNSIFLYLNEASLLECPDGELDLLEELDIEPGIPPVSSLVNDFTLYTAARNSLSALFFSPNMFSASAASIASMNLSASNLAFFILSSK